MSTPINKAVRQHATKLTGQEVGSNPLKGTAMSRYSSLRQNDLLDFSFKVQIDRESLNTTIRCLRSSMHKAADGIIEDNFKWVRAAYEAKLYVLRSLNGADLTDGLPGGRNGVDCMMGDNGHSDSTGKDLLNAGSEVDVLVGSAVTECADGGDKAFTHEAVASMCDDDLVDLIFEERDGGDILDTLDAIQANELKPEVRYVAGAHQSLARLGMKGFQRPRAHLGRHDAGDTRGSCRINIPGGQLPPEMLTALRDCIVAVRPRQDSD